MSARKHEVRSNRGRDRSNRVRAVVTLSTGATKEIAGDWAHSMAHRTAYTDTARRAELLARSVRASKAAQVTWPELGISIARIDVFVDERTTWTEEHEILTSTLHAQHEVGGGS